MHVIPLAFHMGVPCRGYLDFRELCTEAVEWRTHSTLVAELRCVWLPVVWRLHRVAGDRILYCSYSTNGKEQQLRGGAVGLYLAS